MHDVMLTELSVASHARRNLITVKCADTDMKPLAAVGGKVMWEPLLADLDGRYMYYCYDLFIVCRAQISLTQECGRRLKFAEHLPPPGIEAALPH